jgi:hypothetical protein
LEIVEGVLFAQSDSSRAPHRASERFAQVQIALVLCEAFCVLRCADATGGKVRYIIAQIVRLIVERLRIP